MKNFAILMLALSGFVAHAQQSIPQPDLSKISGRTLPHFTAPIICSGSTNMQSADLNWKPILTKKYTGSESLSPNEALIQKIKEEKLQLKRSSENKKNTARTTSVTPVVGTNFAGNLNSGFSPLDNSIAVSNGGYIISVANATIGIYNTVGTFFYLNNITTFLGDATLTNVSAPEVLYDAGSDRFIFICQEINAGGIFGNNRVILCFSKSNNPTAGFWRYELTGDPTGTGNGFDFPKVAVNDSEVFYTGNLYTIGTPNIFHEAVLLQFSKLQGYAGGTIPAGGYYTGIPGSPFTLLPVSYGQNGNYDPGIFLVSTENVGGSILWLYQVSANLCCSPVLNQWGIGTAAYSPPANSMQSGTSCLLNTGDCRALSGFFLNNTVHFAFNSDDGTGYTGINYNRLSVLTLTDNSSIFKMPGFDCAYPSVVSYATLATDASVMIGFGRSGSTIFPEIQVVNCDSTMSWSSPTLVHSSDSFVSYTSTTVERWGDYTGTSRLHTSATPSIWMNGMFGNASNAWDTWIAEIQDTPVPVCDTPTGLSATAITLTSATLTWTAVAGATSYNIRYRPTGSGTWTNTTSATTSKNITGLTSGTTYEFQVETVCTISSTSNFSSSTDFTTLVDHTGVATINNPSGSRIFPNPVTNTFTVEFPLSETVQLNIAVMDMNGKTVKELYNGPGTAGDNVFSFDKTNLSGGVYFLVIRSNETTIRNEKIVVVK